MLKMISRWAWIGAIIWGFVLVGSGIFMVTEGRAAYNEVKTTLGDERIVTAEDAGIPQAPVTGPAEAKAQAEVIKKHILTQTGGKTYAELDRTDPLRNTYLTSVTLRSALMQAYLAFNVASLVVGVGAIIAVLGASHIVLGLYLGLVVVRPFARTAEGAAAPVGRRTVQGV